MLPKVLDRLSFHLIELGCMANVFQSCPQATDDVFQLVLESVCTLSSVIIYPESRGVPED